MASLPSPSLSPGAMLGTAQNMPAGVLVNAVISEAQIVADYIVALENQVRVLAKGMMDLSRDNYRVAETAKLVLTGKTENLAEGNVQPFVQDAQGLSHGQAPGNLLRPAILNRPLPDAGVERQNITLLNTTKFSKIALDAENIPPADTKISRASQTSLKSQNFSPVMTVVDSSNSTPPIPPHLQTPPSQTLENASQVGPNPLQVPEDDMRRDWKASTPTSAKKAALSPSDTAASGADFKLNSHTIQEATHVFDVGSVSNFDKITKESPSNLEVKPVMFADITTPSKVMKTRPFSDAGRSTPETKGSRPTLKDVSPNIVAVRVSKGALNAVQENHKPIAQAALNSPRQPDTDAFFSYLQNKILTDKKAAQDRAALLALEAANWNASSSTESSSQSIKQELAILPASNSLPVSPASDVAQTKVEKWYFGPAFPPSPIKFDDKKYAAVTISSNSSASQESVRECSKAGCAQSAFSNENRNSGGELLTPRREVIQINNIEAADTRIAQMLNIDRHANINKMIGLLDAKYRGLCPALLFGTKCLLNKDLIGGCTMRPVCTTGIDIRCGVQGCNGFHVKKTCMLDIQGKECFKAKSVNREFRSRHMKAAAHQIDCTDEEWFQRVIIAYLVRAHYDGRYR